MTFSLRTTLAAAGGAVLLALTLGSSAAAAPASGGCPPGGGSGWLLRTRAQVETIALEVFESTESVPGLFSAYDKNGDAQLCLKPHPTKPAIFNVVDNVVPSPR